MKKQRMSKEVIWIRAVMVILEAAFVAVTIFTHIKLQNRIVDLIMLSFVILFANLLFSFDENENNSRCLIADLVWMVILTIIFIVRAI